MKIRSVVALVWLTTSFALPTIAQTAKDLVGTWTLVSITLEQGGKETADVYGPNPRGQLIFDAEGHFSEIIIGSDLPKFVSNNRMAGTPEEDKSIVRGSIAFFGTYSVSEAEKTIARHIESCTFPNWNATQRKASFSISGDELSYTSLFKSSVGAGSAHLVWERAK